MRDRKREKERESAGERQIGDVEKAIGTHRNSKKSVERPEKGMLVFFKQLSLPLSVLWRNVRIGQHK